MHQHQVGTAVVQYAGHAGKYGIGNLKERLARSHHVQVVIRCHGKNAKH